MPRQLGINTQPPFCAAPIAAGCGATSSRSCLPVLGFTLLALVSGACRTPRARRLGRLRRRAVSRGARALGAAGPARRCRRPVLLGLMCEQGQGGAVDPYAAVEWYRRAAQQGARAGAEQLGTFATTRGAARASPDSDAARWFEAGRGPGVRRGPVQPGPHAPVGSGRGGEPAASARALRARGGPGRRQGPALARVVARRRGNRGRQSGCGGGLVRAFSRSRAWPSAQFRLGRMYLEGDGVERDEGLARAWFARAARQGVLGAQFGAGWMALRRRGGEGVTRARPARWIETAAERGLAAAQAQLGLMHLRGEGVAARRHTGGPLAVRGRRPGLRAGAVQTWASCTRAGRGVGRSSASRARTHLRAAAEQGLGAALRQTGRAPRARPRGALRNPVTAAMWFPARREPGGIRIRASAARCPGRKDGARGLSRAPKHLARLRRSRWGMFGSNEGAARPSVGRAPNRQRWRAAELGVRSRTPRRASRGCRRGPRAEVRGIS